MAVAAFISCSQCFCSRKSIAHIVGNHKVYRTNSWQHSFHTIFLCNGDKSAAENLADFVVADAVLLFCGIHSNNFSQLRAAMASEQSATFFHSFSIGFLNVSLTPHHRQVINKRLHETFLSYCHICWKNSISSPSAPLQKAIFAENAGFPPMATVFGSTKIG